MEVDACPQEQKASIGTCVSALNILGQRILPLKDGARYEIPLTQICNQKKLVNWASCYKDSECDLS